MDSAFEVDRSRVDGHARVRFVGELDMAEVQRAETEVIEVLDRTAGELTLDLSDLTFCDSSGVRLLYKLHTETEERGRNMVLQHPTPLVCRVLELMGVIDRLTIEDGS
jgi:anti-anti-sigma factor